VIPLTAADAWTRARGLPLTIDAILAAVGD
jgi:hypothetical protein